MITIIVTLFLVGTSFSAIIPLQDTLKFQILHTNDMHARFEETSRVSGVCNEKDLGKRCIGGFARVAHVVKEARKAAGEGGLPILFLNAGDTYTGTAWFGVHRWRIVADFMNELNPDAMSLGNHEFDDGVDGLIPFLENTRFPVLAANLDYSKEPKLAVSRMKKSTIIDVAGRKIGIIGYLTPETGQISNSQDVIFKNEIASLKEESEKLNGRGVKTIIALGHSGFETDKKIAQEVPLVDIVVGGHTNTMLINGPKIDLEEPEGPYPVKVKQKNGKIVPVVQAYAYTKYIGVLNVTIDQNGKVIDFEGQPLYLNSSMPQDPDTLQKLEKYREEVEALDRKVVGRTKVVLEGDANCRLKECNFGNLVADAFVAYHMSVYGGSYWTDTPIGLINGGGVRNTIEGNSLYGRVTRGELLGALPFDNRLVTMSLNGSDLWQTFEISARGNGETSLGEFLQVSGIKVTYDKSKPTGSRVVSIDVRCGTCRVPKYTPLDLEKSYRLITIAFLDNGGDAHEILKYKGYKKKFEDINDLDAVAWYMTEYSPVYPEEQGRITVTGSNSHNLKPLMVLILLSVALIKFTQ